MRWQTVFAGVLGLALLEAAVSSEKAAGRVGDFLEGIAKVVSHVLSPAVPAIPDLRHKGASPSASKDSDSDSSSGGSKTMPKDWDTSAKSMFV